MSDSTKDLIRQIRRQGKICFVFTPTDEQKQLPKDQLKSIIRTNMERCLSAYFNDVDIEPIVNDQGPERY